MGRGEERRLGEKKREGSGKTVDSARGKENGEVRCCFGGIAGFVRRGEEQISGGRDGEIGRGGVSVFGFAFLLLMVLEKILESLFPNFVLNFFLNDLFVSIWLGEKSGHAV